MHSIKSFELYFFLDFHKITTISQKNQQKSCTHTSITINPGYAFQKTIRGQKKKKKKKVVGKQAKNNWEVETIHSLFLYNTATAAATTTLLLKLNEVLIFKR